MTTKTLPQSEEWQDNEQDDGRHRLVRNAWAWCRCGHPMLLHDVEDMDGGSPMCCVDGCDQKSCQEQAGDAR